MSGMNDHNVKYLEINSFKITPPPPQKKKKNIRSSCNGSDLFTRKVLNSNNGKGKRYHIFATFLSHCRKTAGRFLNQTNLASILYVPCSIITHKNTIFKESNKCT